jgi:hypothetical protein
VRSGAARLFDALAAESSIEGLDKPDAELRAAFESIESFYRHALEREAAELVEFNRTLVGSLDVARFDQHFCTAIAATTFLRAKTTLEATSLPTLQANMNFFEIAARPRAVVDVIGAVERAVDRVPNEHIAALWPRLSVFLGEMANRGQNHDAADRAARRLPAAHHDAEVRWRPSGVRRVGGRRRAVRARDTRRRKPDHRPERVLCAAPDRGLADASGVAGRRR